MPTSGSVATRTWLPDDERQVLACWAKGEADELSRRAVRARIVLACAEPGAGDARVAAALGVSRPTVAFWRRRFAQAGPAGLADAGRSGRPKAVLELTAAERAELSRWARQTGTGRALRARIVLTCAAGTTSKDAAVQLEVTEATVARWRRRFTIGRLAGLADRPRPGRPPSIAPQQVQQVIAATLWQPPGPAKRWSRASMARQTGLSASTIGRIWSRSGIRPHLARELTSPAPGQKRGTPGQKVGTPPTRTPRQAREVRKKLISATSGAEAHGGAPLPGQAIPAIAYPETRGTALLAAERRDLLLARLRRDGKLIARELAAELGLSDDSIRRDLRDLAAAGLCQRVYGGALPVSPAIGPQAGRSGIAPDSKGLVGAAAAKLITPGTTVILEGGTTALEVIMALPPDLDATIITHSATTAAALASHPTVNVFMLSGWLNRQSVSASGATAAEAASHIKADLALLITPGVHPHQGFTTADPEDAAIKRIFASRATATYVLASSEKLGTVCACKITDLSEVAGIITDAPVGHPTVQQLRDHGATIVPVFSGG